MKKIFIIALFSIISMGSFAQGFKEIYLKGGYQTNWDRAGAGAEGRIYLNDHFRFAPEVTYFFPTKGLNGLDISGNMHYLINLDIDERYKLYPLMGISMINSRTANQDGKKRGESDFGFNIGAGIQINLGSKFFFNADSKYMFNDHKCLVTMVGFGFRFNE